MNFYKSAALALDHLDKHQGSVKGSLAAAGVNASGSEAKRILALIIETLKYKPILLSLLGTVPIRTLEKLTFPRKTPPKTPSSQSLILVLLQDLLFTTRGIQASDNWPPKAAIKKHSARLKAELVRLQLKAGVSRKEDLAKSASSGSQQCRYIRWNPNINLHREGDWSLTAFHSHLESKGIKRVSEQYPVPRDGWFPDTHLGEEVLVFHGEANWWIKDKWYESGAVILQDKASCFPAKVLMQGWKEGDGECLDATAAPGNKTSYMSALMGDISTLHAFEKSHHRFKTLQSMLAKAECRNVNAKRADFTESDPTSPEFAKITRILLDPSCSGSGIVNRLDYLLEDEVEEMDVQANRLEKLSSFQLQMILHAFKFPLARRIVYSTCSIHAEEDEKVVMRALQSKLAREGGWALAPREDVIPSWDRRGRIEETDGDQELADSMIRCLPEDHTNGFFVACFVKGPSNASSTRKRSRIETEHVEHDEENAAETVEEMVEDVGEEAKVPKEKTAAQAERARRKKALQKKKRKIAE